MSWQPIETAPKDGTVIDLWADGQRLPNCKWRYGGWSQEYAEHPSAHFDIYDEPTHWMPLPEPPK